MKISIIILSYNDYEGTTGKCLTALMADPDFLAWEVLVVDNASDQATQQALHAAQQQMPAVRFVFNEGNLGFAAGTIWSIGAAKNTWPTARVRPGMCPGKGKLMSAACWAGWNTSWSSATTSPAKI